jgi:hypothetical protein
MMSDFERMEEEKRAAQEEDKQVKSFEYMFMQMVQ